VARLPGTPSIAGQPSTFIENPLVLTREGLRDATPAGARHHHGEHAARPANAELADLANHLAHTRKS
jgi:hypothetical protein